MRSFPQLTEHELRTRLGDIAAEHQPDRAAMLHRLGQHRAGAPVTERPPAGQALRLAGSALAVATILGVGGMARWALAAGPEPGVTPVAPPAATTPAPTMTPRTTTAPPSPEPSDSANPSGNAGPADKAGRAGNAGPATSYANKGGRDAGEDTYRVTATTAADATPVDLHGGFF